MIPLPLIARAIVGGGILGLLIYELAKNGAAYVKNEGASKTDETPTAATTASDVVETIKDEVKEGMEAAEKAGEAIKEELSEIKDTVVKAAGEAAEMIKENIEAIATASKDEVNTEHLKSFKKDATKRAVKTHTTKAINKLIEAAVAGHYQLVATSDEALIADLVKDYTKKYKTAIADGTLRINSSSEKKKHFLEVRL